MTDGSWPARQPSEHAPTSSRSLHGIDESNIVAVEVRSRAAPERFSESAHAKWSAYHSSRIGVRHEAVAARVQEATAAEPELFSHLDALYSRLRATALSATGADRTSELVSDMERAAATALHAALIECLASAGLDEESLHIWAGPVRRVKAPREQNATSSLRQVDSLQQWAASLKKGQLVATRVMRDEACIEGLYWLIVLLGVPYTLEQDTVFNTDHFEKGDLVVKASYYKLERANLEGGFRAYVLVEGKQHERLLHVSSLIRLKGLVFDKGPGGPADRALRSGVTKLYYVGSLLHNSILSCCYE